MILETLLWWEISLKGKVLPSVIPMGFFPGKKVVFMQKRKHCWADRLRSWFHIKLNWIIAEAEYLAAQCFSPVPWGTWRSDRGTKDFCPTLHCETPIVGYRKADGGNKKPRRGVGILNVKGSNRDILHWLCSKCKGKPEGQKARGEVGKGKLSVLFCFSVTRGHGNNLE